MLKNKKNLSIKISSLLLIIGFCSIAQSVSAVNVAIFDSGVDIDDPNITSSGCYNPYLDSTNPADCADFIGHGTDVHNIVQSNTGNNVQIYDVNIDPTRDSGGTSQVDAFSNAIDWAIENDIDIVNYSMTIGGGTAEEHQTINDALDRAEDNGILIVNSIPNDTSARAQDDWITEANNSNIIDVGALDNSGRPESYNSPYYTGDVDAWASGDSVDRYQYSYWEGENVDGTSYASPVVTAQIANSANYTGNSNFDANNSLDSLDQFNSSPLGNNSTAHPSTISATSQSTQTTPEGRINAPWTDVDNDGANAFWEANYLGTSPTSFNSTFLFPDEANEPAFSYSETGGAFPFSFEDGTPFDLLDSGVASFADGSLFNIGEGGLSFLDGTEFDFLDGGLKFLNGIGFSFDEVLGSLIFENGLPFKLDDITGLLSFLDGTTFDIDDLGGFIFGDGTGFVLGDIINTIITDGGVTGLFDGVDTFFDIDTGDILDDIFGGGSGSNGGGNNSNSGVIHYEWIEVYGGNILTGGGSSGSGGTGSGGGTSGGGSTMPTGLPGSCSNYNFSTASSNTGVDEGLLVGIASAESSCNSSAVSPAGACGIMQLKPETARAVTGASNITCAWLQSHPQESIEIAAKFLEQNESILNSYASQYGYDIGEDDLIASYNAGTGDGINADGTKQPFALSSDCTDRPTPAWQCPTNAGGFNETQNYIPRVQAYRDIYNNRSTSGGGTSGGSTGGGGTYDPTPPHPDYGYACAYPGMPQECYCTSASVDTVWAIPGCAERQGSALSQPSTDSNTESINFFLQNPDLLTPSQQ